MKTMLISSEIDKNKIITEYSDIITESEFIKIKNTQVPFYLSFEEEHLWVGNNCSDCYFKSINHFEEWFRN